MTGQQARAQANHIAKNLDKYELSKVQELKDAVYALYEPYESGHKEDTDEDESGHRYYLAYNSLVRSEEKMFRTEGFIVED